VTTYFFFIETVVWSGRPFYHGAGCGVLHDLPGHPVPSHACLGGPLVAAHLQAYYVLSLAKLLLRKSSPILLGFPAEIIMPCDYFQTLLKI
jgi:hypothetical protein